MERLPESNFMATYKQPEEASSEGGAPSSYHFKGCSELMARHDTHSKKEKGAMEPSKMDSSELHRNSGGLLGESLCRYDQKSL